MEDIDATLVLLHNLSCSAATGQDVLAEAALTPGPFIGFRILCVDCSGPSTRPVAALDETGLIPTE
jgi:hypothetical protein